MDSASRPREFILPHVLTEVKRRLLLNLIIKKNIVKTDLTNVLDNACHAACSLRSYRRAFLSRQRRMNLRPFYNFVIRSQAGTSIQSRARRAFSERENAAMASQRRREEIDLKSRFRKRRLLHDRKRARSYS